MMKEHLELIAAYDPDMKTPLGYYSKATIHNNGYWHFSSIVIIAAGAKMLILTRGKHQSFAGKLDTLGGHPQIIDGGVLLNTAYRETCEEVEAEISGRPFFFDRRTFQRIGGAERYLTSDAESNRERAALFFVRKPASVSIKTVADDGDDGHYYPLHHQWCSLSDLELAYHSDPTFTADGLGRVLQACKENPTFRDELCQLLHTEEWRLFFACTLPDEPGCGCPDGDFIAEHRYSGSRSDAEKEAERISWHQYRGDFRWWIEPY